MKVKVEVEIADFETADAACKAVRDCLLKQLGAIEARFGSAAALMVGEWITSTLLVESCHTSGLEYGDARELVEKAWEALAPGDIEPGAN